MSSWYGAADGTNRKNIYSTGTLSASPWLALPRAASATRAARSHGSARRALLRNALPKASCRTSSLNAICIHLFRSRIALTRRDHVHRSQASTRLADGLNTQSSLSCAALLYADSNAFVVMSGALAPRCGWAWSPMADDAADIADSSNAE